MAQAIALGVKVMTDALSSLALDAAIEVDNLLSKKTADKVKDTEAVRKLAIKLRETAGVPDSVDTFKTLASPTTVNVFSRAVSAYRGKQLESLTELVEDLQELLGVLEQPVDQTDKTQLEHVLGFCLALHKEILLQRADEIEATKTRATYRT